MLRMTPVIILGIAVLCGSGCSQNPARPCGPGILGNRLIPQQFAGADFRPACHNHDACYGVPCASRKACDVAFWEEMQATCNCSSHPALCRMKAMNWYTQVRLFGGPAFRMSQRDAHEGVCCDECAGDELVGDEMVPEPEASEAN